MIYVYQAGLPDDDGFMFIPVGKAHCLSWEAVPHAGDFIEYTRIKPKDDSVFNEHVVAVVVNVVQLRHRCFVVVGDAIGTAHIVETDSHPQRIELRMINWPNGADAELHDLAKQYVEGAMPIIDSDLRQDDERYQGIAS